MIPLHLVTGFLGAGKTVFLNRLLRDPALSDTLVVVNEFGEEPLDHRLYERINGEISLFGAGCLCCSLRGDFIDGMCDILGRGDGSSFRRIVVETSGLAEPGPILHALFADATLSMRLRLANVTTLVDAVNGVDTLERHGEARRQVALADQIAVSKTDLGSDEDLRARLATLAPFAHVSDARDITGAEFLVETLRPPTSFSPRAVHGGAQASVYRSATPLPPLAFAQFLDRLAQFAGPRLLRVKGLVATADAPDRPWLVQGAQHVFAEPQRLPGWPDGARETALVVIGEDIAATVQQLWDALRGRAAPDTPDWSTLTDNPLAPRSSGLLR